MERTTTSILYVAVQPIHEVEYRISEATQNILTAHPHPSVPFEIKYMKPFV